MNYSIYDSTLALAGVFQAAALVDQIARTGQYSHSAYDASLQSLFKRDPESVAAVYGEDETAVRLGIKLGLTELQEVLDKSRGNQNMNVIRYALSLIHLENKLNKRSDLLAVIANRLDQIDPTEVDIDNQFAHHNVKTLADIYRDTISTFQLRIQVTGEPRWLKVDENAERIRALLLAGMRSAVLWRQTGGRRWQLIFKRRKYLNAIDDLLKTRH